MQKKKLFVIGSTGFAAGVLAVACYLIGIWVGLGDYSWDDGLDDDHDADGYVNFEEVSSAHP